MLTSLNHIATASGNPPRESQPTRFGITQIGQRLGVNNDAAAVMAKVVILWRYANKRKGDDDIAWVARSRHEWLADANLTRRRWDSSLHILVALGVLERAKGLR